MAIEATAPPIPRSRTLPAELNFDRRTVGAWTLGFAPVLYLGLRGGGYDLVVRSEAGFAAWWIVLLGVLAGVLPLTKTSKLAYVSIGLLAVFALWTGIASGWSSSAERSVAELGRISTYLG